MMEQRRAPCFKGIHPQLLEAPPDRLATPGGGGGKLLAALQPQPGRFTSKSCTGDRTGADPAREEHQGLLQPETPSTEQQIL